MRILDKYLLREAVWPLVYCFDAFALLLLVLDLFDNLPDFLRFHAPLGQVFRYYLTIFPDMFVFIMPMAILLAFLFTLSRLGRHNELIAMRASGISVIRIATPLLLLGLISSVIIFGVNELFVPQAKENGEGFIRQLSGKATAGIVENLFYTNQSENRDWYARTFDKHTYEVTNLDIHEQQSDGTPIRDIYAGKAIWANDSWQFYDVLVYDHSNPAHIPIRVSSTNFVGITDSPKRLEAEGKNPEEMMSAELRRYIRTQKRAGLVDHLAEYEVTLHYRYAFPTTCMVVALIAIPLGIRSGRGGALLSVGTALAIVISFHFVTHMVLAFGRGGHIPPVVAAWLTNVTFGSVGIGMLLRTR